MTVEVHGSVTPWLNPLKEGDPAAKEYLWSRYFELAVQLARTQLQGVHDRGRDEEDVALSALHDFFRAAGRGDMERLHNRNDLWRLLATCTLNRARKHRRDSQRLKRGGGLPRERPVSLKTPDWRLTSRESSPEEACQLADELQSLLELLDHEDSTGRLRKIAVWKLEGFTDEEIAQCQNCTRKTISAKLTLIRGLWREADPT
jgi:DNA-directed RNA polymerase specialized sigma24 family protein